MSLATTALGLTALIWVTAMGSGSWWIPVMVAVPGLYTLLVMPVSIRRIERRSAAGVPPTAPTPAKKFGIAVWGIAWCVGLPALTGYLVSGATLAAIFGGGAAVYLAILVLFIRWRRKRRATSAGTP